MRTPEATADITAARAEPTPADLDVERMAAIDRKIASGGYAKPPTRAGMLEAMAEIDHAVNAATAELANAPGPGPQSLTLTGSELTAYLRLRGAAAAAAEAQTQLGVASQALRDALGQVCQAIGKP